MVTDFTFLAALHAARTELAAFRPAFARPALRALGVPTLRASLYLLKAPPSTYGATRAELTRALNATRPVLHTTFVAVFITVLFVLFSPAGVPMLLGFGITFFRALIILEVILHIKANISFNSHRAARAYRDEEG